MSPDKGCEKDPKSSVKTSPKPSPISTTKAKGVLQKAIGGLTKGGFPQQFVAGTTAGWVTGYCVSRVGRTVAFFAGASLLGLTVAQHQGLVKESQVKGVTDQARVRYQQTAPSLVNKVKVFANKNKIFAAGFTGGFLLGISH